MENIFDGIKSWWDVSLPTIAAVLMAIVLLRNGDPSGVTEVTEGGTELIDTVAMGWDMILALVGAVVSGARAIFNGFRKVGKFQAKA